MDTHIFQFKDYKQYLNALCEARPRGFRKALAEVTQCQTAYISRVLNGGAHLSWEQAEAAARFIGLTKEETRYLLLLIEHGRAGTGALRQLLSEQLGEMREKHLLLRNRVGIQATLSRENQTTYYSSWHYAAIHVAVSVPALQTREALRKGLRMPARKLAETLDFLVSVGLVRRDGDRFTPGTTLVHLEKTSPSIYQHHANWRMKALGSMHTDRASENIYYSSVFTLSAEDVLKVRAWITRNIGEWIQVVKDSKEEEVYGLTLDFFKVDA